MKYRITVHFGPFNFTTECGSIAAAFRHMEALFFSPMYEATQEQRETACAEYMLLLADIARGKRDYIENALFRLDGIRGGRRA